MVIITINQFCQAKRDEFGEPIIRKEMAIPSQANLQVGRCRDYWRGLVPLITSKSVPPSNRIRGEDIVQSLEKSRIRCTESEDTLTINNYYYAAFAVEDVITPMVKINQMEAYVPELGYALAKQEDDDLAALIDDGTLTNSVGTLATGLTYDNYVRADQYLQDAEAPDDDRVIILSHAEKANALKQDQFTNSQYVKLQQGTSNTGLLGGILGYPVFVTGNTNGTNAAGHDSVMLHKSAIFFAQQIAPNVNTFWDIDYFCAKVSALETYGLAVNGAYADHACWMKGL